MKRVVNRGKPLLNVNKMTKHHTWIMDKKSKAKKHLNRIYILAVTISLVFLGSGLTLVLNTGNLSREDTLGHIQKAVQQTKFAIEEHIQEEFDTLKMASVVAQERDLLDDDEVLRSLINGLSAHNAYVQLGFADTQGQAVWHDRHGRQYRADFSGEDFLRRALRGEEALSEARYDEVNKTLVHYFAVPVYNGKTDVIRGVLFAADPQDEMKTIINNSLYAGEGLSHIINAQGEYIIKSESPLVISVGGGIYDLKTPIARRIQDVIEGDLRAKRAGHLAAAFYGENRLIAYTPLDINDWFVFYAVPEDLVSAGLKNVLTGAIFTFSIATAVFVVFLLLIRMVNNKNREDLETLVYVDPLTGHRNFQKFLLDAKEVLRNANGTRYALCYGDIKDFRYINEMFGRSVGDRLLRYFADFLQTTSLKGEVVGRIREDSFVLLLRFKSKKEISLRFESAAQHLAVFPETFSHSYRIELYGGVYVLSEEDGELSLNDMLDRAVAAQETAKFSGDAKRHAFYTKEMRDKKVWEAELEARMEAALENNEFQIYLQPKIDIQHGDRIIGAEALVRWVSPEKGLIQPARFIELFERNGFIVELDRHVFDAACRLYKKTVLDGGIPPFVLSVNVSRLGLMRPDFVRSYTEIRKSYGIQSDCIELEFTESLAVDDHVLFEAIVADCRSNGFLCSMDDFGSGYSSLNMLKSLHVDVLKLDRHLFVYKEDSERGQEIIRCIIQMAKALNMKTVAEGIDAYAQVDQLRQMGCDAIQGFVFARPMPTDEFERFMETWGEHAP